MIQVFDCPYAHEQSRLFRKYYSAVAEQCGCSFLAAEDYAEAGAGGVHITRESHLRLAQAIAKKRKSCSRIDGPDKKRKHRCGRCFR